MLSSDWLMLITLELCKTETGATWWHKMQLIPVDIPNRRRDRRGMKYSFKCLQVYNWVLLSHKSELAYPFIRETGPDKRGCLPVSCLHFLCGSDPIFRRVYTNHRLQVICHSLFWKAKAPLNMSWVWFIVKKSRKTKLDSTIKGEWGCSSWNEKGYICNSPILYDFNLNSYMRSEDKGRTEFFYCPQSPRLARVLNAQAQMGGAVGATERDSD